jgi:Cytochrome c oxidase subunit IV
VTEEQNQGEKGARKALPPKGVQEQAFGPQRSIWPFGLAVALIILLVGLITNLVVLGIGVALTVAAIIGWGLEQRK